MPKHEEIKTMHLYRHLDRIERRLQELGYTSKDVPVDPEQLGTLDSLHFFGDEPIRNIVRLLANTPEDKKVLDIGTGYGGTARLLAHRSGCKVDALELQPDLSEAGRELTRRCGLDSHVTHLNGDFLELSLQKEEYDAVVSLLCFLHIGNWRQLFKKCFDILKPGGFLYIDDFFVRGVELTKEVKLTLKQDVYCANLLRQTDLHEVLKDCGFEDISFQDVTTKWLPYLTNRALQYRASLDSHIARDGETAARDLEHFYTSVARVFQAGNVGGYTLIVRKPL
ncbi:putative S-adenosyl-L-methionine-dependent methyltransferase [Plasmopara halstedii]